MKKKFASFLLTGKAATLPFYAPATLADGHLLPMHQKGPGMHMPAMGGPIMCDTEAPDDFTLSLPELQDEDLVFIFASEDTKDWSEDGFPDLKLGLTGLKVVGAFMPIGDSMFDFKEEAGNIFDMGNYTLGEERGSVIVDVPSMGFLGSFHLQVFILRGENYGDFVFSEMDTITRGSEGCGGSYGEGTGGEGVYGEGGTGGEGVYGDGGTGGEGVYGPGAGGTDTGSGGDTYGGDAGGSGGAYGGGAVAEAY